MHLHRSGARSCQQFIVIQSSQALQVSLHQLLHSFHSCLSHIGGAMTYSNHTLYLIKIIYTFHKNKKKEKKNYHPIMVPTRQCPKRKIQEEILPSIFLHEAILKTHSTINPFGASSRPLSLQQDFHFKRTNTVVRKSRT